MERWHPFVVFVEFCCMQFPSRIKNSRRVLGLVDLRRSGSSTRNTEYPFFAVYAFASFYVCPSVANEIYIREAIIDALNMVSNARRAVISICVGC